LILLDTHIWIWWLHRAPVLRPAALDYIEGHRKDGIAISVISCWEVAKLVENRRLDLGMDVESWLAIASEEPDVIVLDLSLDVIVDSTRLPGTFHRDPADQMIVATSRVSDIPLVKADKKILDYPHVNTWGES